MMGIVERITGLCVRKQEGEWTESEVHERFGAYLRNADLGRSWAEGNYVDAVLTARHSPRASVSATVWPEYARDDDIAEYAAFLLAACPFADRFYVHYELAPHWYVVGVYRLVIKGGRDVKARH